MSILDAAMHIAGPALAVAFMMWRQRRHDLALTHALKRLFDLNTDLLEQFAERITRIEVAELERDLAAGKSVSTTSSKAAEVFMARHPGSSVLSSEPYVGKR